MGMCDACVHVVNECVHMRVQVCPTSASVVVMAGMPCTCSGGSRNTRSVPLGVVAGVWTAVCLKGKWEML